jgi:hypothetical protein
MTTSRLPGARGYSLIEVLVSGVLVLIAALSGVAYVTRSAQHADWARDRVFARQKAESILGEIRAYVEGGEGEVAADLDGFDDGLGVLPSLTISPDPQTPGAFLPPEHPVSGNIRDSGAWRWHRRITVRPFPGVEARDLRIVTVRIFRHRTGDRFPGEMMAEISTVIRTIGDAYPTTQVYDVYLLALENVPGWWVYMDAIQPFIEATLTDLESRNPGLEFRRHWIKTLDYGRDEEYAPYTNETQDSQADIPWAYVYPGRMPAGSPAQRYYVAGRMRARVNVDGTAAAQFENGYAASEGWTDVNGNGRHDPGEPFADANGNGRWDAGNPVPYALADQHNHGLRWPEAHARFQARVAAGLDVESAPTWRLLLDRMIAEPDRYHNAILINLHGELLPMPPARNVSDPAKAPTLRPGWRVVTHPERLRPLRVAGNEAASEAPRFRVYAWKTRFPDAEVATTQPEPFLDLDGDGLRDATEPFQDWNGNGVWDAGVPATVVVRGGDFTWAPNAATAPSIRIRRLAGGVDANGDGAPEPYAAWADAPRYPETFSDTNADGIRQVAELWLDLNGNGAWDPGEPHREVDGDGRFTPATEALQDANGNGRYDPARPAEPFVDKNGNGRWDPAEPWWDLDGDGAWTPPTAPQTPWVPWNPANFGNPAATAAYVAAYGEPFLDVNGNGAYDAAEDFFDSNQNGVCDGGFERGEMWYGLAYDAAANHTVVTLWNTPLETPYRNDAQNDRRGLPAAGRLYDLDYVPCPTPVTATSTNRFGRDLHYADSAGPKNTARWTIELPPAAIRRAFASAPGANDGDAADRIVTLETRFGSDLNTGTAWPVRRDPPNLSITHAWYYANVADVPFSERFQFLGDPRHQPYLDLDARGTTSRNGYNWYFDDFNAATNEQGRWLAFDAPRLRDGWGARGSGHDVPRLLQWLRTALVRTEAVYTTITGFSYFYLSVGGDVGYDAANGFPSGIPMDGRPFGLTGDVFENSIIDGAGTASIRGSAKYVRSNDGAAAALRSGGYWWSKPWLGELWPDTAYAGQWAAYGNLRANTGTASGEFRLIRRGDVTASQQPPGTALQNRFARLAAEGCTSVFNIGTSSSTFHHQFQDGGTGSLTGDGPQLAQNYNFPLPTTTAISRPFGLATSGSGGVGDEFAYTDSYPRFSAAMVRRFYNHQNGQTGSGLVRLQEPGANPRGCHIVVNGIDRTLESGSAFIARYSILTLIHGFFAAGAPGSPNRVRQLPRIQIVRPTLVTEIDDPSTIPVQWSTEWTRWDGRPYTAAYPAGFAEDESDLVYVPMVSLDGGRTWRSMMDGQPVQPGVVPWIEGVGPDPARTVTDQNVGADEVFTWDTPAADFPEGSYLIRVEGYRASESLHYAHHMEKIYVKR